MCICDLFWLDFLGFGCCGIGCCIGCCICFGVCFGGSGCGCVVCCCCGGYGVCYCEEVWYYDIDVVCVEWVGFEFDYLFWLEVDCVCGCVCGGIGVDGCVGWWIVDCGFYIGIGC